MISEYEKATRQIAYEFVKNKSIARGVDLTPETESLMKRFINGEITKQEFLLEIPKVAGLDSGGNDTIH
jgi:hypothetical protein